MVCVVLKIIMPWWRRIYWLGVGDGRADIGFDDAGTTGSFKAVFVPSEG
jgi:hypothetical protein